MKLVATKLQGICEQAGELQRLEALTKYQEVRDDLCNLQTQIKGCLQFLDELNLAYESLHSAGYSTEWMDIINKDNNFMAIVNVDMPRFFGGDEAKQAACEGAIIDTIKKWAATVWDWIKKAYDKLREILKWVMGLWVHQRPKGEVLQTFNKVTTMMAKSDNPKVRDAYRVCFEDMEIKSPTVLLNYIESYDALADVLNDIVDEVEKSNVEDLWQTIDEMTNRGVMDIDQRNQFLVMLTDLATKQADINSSILNYITRKWINPAVKVRKGMPSKEHNGFMFGSQAGSGIIEFVRVYTEEDNIPIVKFGYSQFDVPDQQMYLKQSESVIERGRQVVTKLESRSKTSIKKLVEKFAKRARDQVANVNIAPDSPRLRLSQSMLKLCQTCLLIDAELSSKTSIILHRLSAQMNTLTDRLNTIAKNIGQESK